MQQLSLLSLVSPCTSVCPVLMLRIRQPKKNVSDDRGSQGNQDLIKGDSTPKKGEDEKVDDAKVKADTQKAREEFEKRNAKGRENTGDKRKDTP